MVGELVIHLGDHGTGASALQTALAAGSVRIAAEVPFYAGPRAYQLADPLMQSDPDPAFYRPRFIRVAEQLDQSAAAIGILSDANFEHVAPQMLAAVIEECLPQYRGRLRLVAYVRPHVDHFVASFAEQTGRGLQTELMEPFLERAIRHGMLDHAPRFARWAEVFGDRFTLRPYMRDQLADQDIVTDFATWLARGRDWSRDGTAKAQDRLHETPGLTDIAVSRMLQQRAGSGASNLPPKARRAMGAALAEIMAARPDPDAVPLGIDRKLATKIAARFADDAAALDAAFFPDAAMVRALRAAQDHALDAAQSLAPQDCLSPASLRLTHAAGDLLLRVAATDPARFAQTMRRPAARQDGAKAAVRPTTQIYALTDRLGHRFIRSLGWFTRSLRHALNRIGR